MEEPTKAWSPTDDQMNDVISPVWGDITSQLEQLQKDLDCPDSFIAGMLEAMLDNWKS